MHHMLMLSNTVHTGFGQKLCMMDNPKTAKAVKYVDEQIMSLLNISVCNHVTYAKS